MFKWRPSRGQLAFFGSVASIGGAYYYDRSKVKEIQSQLIIEAKKIADMPCDLSFTPRYMTVYIAEGHADIGKYKGAFEQFVKPIWDAAGLDYKVIVGFKWHDDIKDAVQTGLTAKWTELKPEHIDPKQSEPIGTEEAKLRRRKALIDLHEVKLNSDGIIAVGRDAFKGLLYGIKNATELETLPGSDKNNESVNLNHHPETDLDKLNSSEAQRTWYQWMTGALPTKDLKSITEEHQETIDDDGISSVPIPPIGFIPFVNHPWYWRILYFFYKRKDASIMGHEALAIAQGYHVSLIELFPGDIIFPIEKDEKNDSEKKKSESENSEHEQDSLINVDNPDSNKDSAELTDKDVLVENIRSEASIEGSKIQNVVVPEEVIIPEELIQHIRKYYPKPQNLSEDDSVQSFH